VDKTKFNDVEVVDSALADPGKRVAIAYSHLTANTSNVGPEVTIAAIKTISKADGADTTADTLLASVAEGLGNLAADLTALKAFQGAAAATSANMAAAGGVLGALFASKILNGKADVTMAINGAIAGLVAITAAADTPTGGLSTLIGIIGGVIVYFSIIILDTKLKIDDPVGAISAHGIVGILGVMVVPLTSDASFVWQVIGVISIAGFTFFASLGTILLINSFMPIRASDEEQDVGLDLSEIGVEAYPDFK